MKVEVQQALIHTVSVEVKTLMISGKQVTLAVFRQLEEEAIIDYPPLRLLGPVWGRVNYHTKCKGEHLHIVWQKGNELRQARVDRASRNYTEYLKSYRDSLVIEHWARHACEGLVWEKDSRLVKIDGQEFTLPSDLPEYVRDLICLNSDQPGRYGKVTLSKETLIAAALKEFPLSIQESHNEVQKYKGYLQTAAHDWNLLYTQLLSTDQLFIAV